MSAALARGVPFLVASPALAGDLFGLDQLSGHQEVAGVSILAGLTLFSTITALLHLTGRKTWTERESALTRDLTDARARLDRATVFLSAERQIVVAWTSQAADPEIEGDLSLVTDAPVARRVLGFGSWLAPTLAQPLEQAVERLRVRGEGFRMPVVTLAGRHLETEGRAVGGRAILRIRDVAGDRLDLTRLREHHAQVSGELEGLRAMLDAVPSPVWMRDRTERLTWVNAAYAHAVEAHDGADAVARGLELLDRPARDAASEARGHAVVWRQTAAAVVAGERHTLDVIDVPSGAGSVGIAVDQAELEAARGELRRQIASHARTLDQVSTAVAIFDRAKRLVFHNAAYRQLWPLDASFLEQGPSDGEVLDRLRAERRLPEQADYRAWKGGLMSAYHALETVEQVWHLPDGRTLRAVTNPNPQGGVTYLFDDVTEQFSLKSRFNALARVQGETLEGLKEGVAVFGTDGGLKLSNPAFARLWRIAPAALEGQPHVDAVAALANPLCADTRDWEEVRRAVAGFHDARTGVERRMTRRDGSVVDCTTAPLPDGATLITFFDVTDGVNVERALKERNQALIDAEKLRNDFVHHVSYQLRSPLTTIIGFTHLLADGTVGPLNERQLEYAGYVETSSASLLAIINDILDLASIDTGAMALEIADVDILGTIEAAAGGVRDRLAESDLRLQIVADRGIGAFQADAKRVRQVLFNLLSNAIAFSLPGQTVTLAALRREGEVVFKVSDEGRGIPPELIDKVFERFETDPVGSRHRGVGLGLSMVRSFVELHGGRVLIDSAPGVGTTVTCLFPLRETGDLARIVA